MGQLEHKEIIAVIGMHRSGTSAVTRGLQVMGIALGENLIEAADGINPKGFWEDADLNELNRELLSSLGMDWQSLKRVGLDDVAHLTGLGFGEKARVLLNQKTHEKAAFGFKDPRVAKLFPFWYPVLERSGLNVCYLYVLRNPMSVVQSLLNRDRMHPVQAYYLWLGHLVPTLRYFLEKPVFMVDYDRFISEPERELREMATSFGYELDSCELRVYKNEFLDTNLRHSSFEMSDLESNPDCPDIVREVYGTILRVASRETSLADALDGGVLERWEEEFDRLDPAFRLMDEVYDRVSASMERHRRQGDSLAVQESIVEVLKHDLGERERIIRELLQSQSWKITRPLRALMRLARGASQTRDAQPDFLGKPCVNLEDDACPLTFVVVRFSGYFETNFGISSCYEETRNQTVVVDNRGNLEFARLGEALNYGLEQANNEIVVLVHEDVFLHANWQRELDRALYELSQVDPDWAVLGCAGLTSEGETVGHYEDPHGHANTFGCDEYFRAVRSLDEHLLILRKSNPWRFDPDVPGIHGLGVDLILSAEREGKQAYVVNAKSWHKYRDERGRPVLFGGDSEKIKSRETVAYLAEKQCCDDYVSKKWGHLVPFRSNETSYEVFRSPVEQLGQLENLAVERLDRPIVLIGLGADEVALLHALALEIGVSVGTITNGSEETIELAQGVYQAFIQKYKCSAHWQIRLAPSQLRLAGARLMRNLKGTEDGQWGFISSVGGFLLPELAIAFPKAKFVFLERGSASSAGGDPLSIASLGNEIGRALMPVVYDWLGQDRQKALGDSEHKRSGHLRAFQTKLRDDFLRTGGTEARVRRIVFEDGALSSEGVYAEICAWLGCTS